MADFRENHKKLLKLTAKEKNKQATSIWSQHCGIMNSIHFIEAVLQEWGTQLIFLELHYYQQHTSQLPPDTTSASLAIYLATPPTQTQVTSAVVQKDTSTNTSTSTDTTTSSALSSLTSSLSALGAPATALTSSINSLTANLAHLSALAPLATSLFDTSTSSSPSPSPPPQPSSSTSAPTSILSLEELRGSLFDPVLEDYKQFNEFTIKSLVSFVVSTFDRNTYSYRSNGHMWSLPIPIIDSDHPQQQEISSSLCDAIVTLQYQMVMVEKYAGSALHRQFWTRVAHQLDLNIFRDVIQNHYFSITGIEQFTFDMKALFALFQNYTSVPANYMRHIKESLLLMSLTPHQRQHIRRELQLQDDDTSMPLTSWHTDDIPDSDTSLERSYSAAWSAYQIQHAQQELAKLGIHTLTVDQAIRVIQQIKGEEEEKEETVTKEQKQEVDDDVDVDADASIHLTADGELDIDPDPIPETTTTTATEDDDFNFS